MIVPRAPSAFACTLPAPWHASQPVSATLPALRASRLCVAVGNFSVMSAWHSAQALVPTKSAPATNGGASMVGFTATQEMSNRPQAADPPKIRLFRVRHDRKFMEEESVG